ncbi:hypothetical protein [Paenilisteria newyorkensis]|uniref:hypothetical protein n=1 Tax=Listeria newyorkensis TaxID=1497681 RepID=UPI002358100F|nr:hypothetical protein [Listeria newyorkensis]WAO20812.1 hypothetical protein OTR81_10980 [Listeria newyorkensis]
MNELTNQFNNQGNNAATVVAASREMEEVKGQIFMAQNMPRNECAYVSFDKRLGFIAELLPPELRADDIMGMDHQKAIMWLWQGARENIEEVDELQKELSSTNETLETALEMISDLQEENKALEQRVSDIEEFIKGRLLRR